MTTTTGKPRWYCTYQIECDRCGQTYAESSVNADDAATRHERRCGGEVWASSLALPYALTWPFTIADVDKLVNERVQRGEL